MTTDSEQRRPPESYSDKELIEYRRRQWEDFTRLSQGGDDYDPTPVALRTTSFIGAYQELDPARTASLNEILGGYPLVDLGGGLKGWPDELLDKFGVPLYINVDLQHGSDSTGTSTPKRENRSQDLLEALLALPDNQPVNVTSNGVLMGDWFRFAADPLSYENSFSQRSLIDVEQTYLNRLFRAVHRVLPTNGVFMAHPNRFHNLAEQHGLILDKNLSTFAVSGETNQKPVLAIYKKGPMRISLKNL